MATSTVNGAINIEGNPGNTSLANSGRPQSKSPYGAKVADANRKSSINASDGSQRRNNPQKAWTTGMNPITQRSHGPSQQNGTSKATLQKANASQETNTADQHAHDRLLFLLGNFMGLPARLTSRNGDVFVGIFAGSIMEGNEAAYLLKMVRPIKRDDTGEARMDGEATSDYVGVGEDHAMSFDVKETVDLAVENVFFNTAEKPQNGVATGFRTDADISGNLAFRERDLQRWEPSTESDVDLSLEPSGASWDQFEANEQRFGLKSDYDENLYTTRIDRTNPLYRMREAEAERIAREIEGDFASNSHMREERGINLEDDGVDEEEKYSGVRRNGQEYPPLRLSQANKYTPPARRAPTGKSGVPGVPVDPAIISSQIARPESKPQPTQKNDLTQVGDSGKATETKAEPSSTLPKQEPVTTKAAPPKPTLTGKTGTPAGSATENVETEVLDSFRQFANIEKMRVQDSRRNRASQDKAIKLNDLMKFSKNFKLLTPVPKDLVPILAKDKSKQDEIMEKAQRNAAESAGAPALKSIGDQKAQRPLAAARYEGGHVPIVPSERQNYPRGRQGLPPQGPQAIQPLKDRTTTQNQALPSPRSGQGLLSHRLADSHRMHKQGVPFSVPSPLPIQDARVPPTGPAGQATAITSPQKSGKPRSPTSAVSAKFNVKAMEFKPNPAATSFKPTSGTSSPRPASSSQRVSRASSPSAFFGSRKPLPQEQRTSILDNFNPLKWLKKEAQNDKNNNYAFNGGIKPAYKTPPTWNPPKASDDFKSYKDMFENQLPASRTVTPQHNSPVNQPLAHQHQLPPHLQSGPHGVPQVHTPHQLPHHLHPQHHHYPSASHHYDDHRMHPSASSSSMYPSPSPRMQHTNMAYPSPMSQSAQLAYGQPVPHYVMAPNVPQPGHFRQFPGGPQMIASQGPHLAAPMMVQQPSGGGFMGMPQGVTIPFNPQMAVYPPGTPQPYGGPSQPPSGYPSPGRGAPMMMHQGSHQGQHPQMFMSPGQYNQPLYAQQPPAHMTPMRGYASPQPHYNQPHQQHHYPPQPHRAPSNSGYAQLPQMPPQHMSGQQAPPPQAAASMEIGEEAK